MVEFEHTIFILLLLSGVLNAKPPRQRWATLIIAVGILLVFLPPARQIPIPWEMILGLVIPLLLWQNTRRIVNADWRGWKSITLWCGAALIFSSVLWLIGALNWPGALLFGILAASMIWRAGEPVNGASYMSQIGPLTLMFLLTEVEAAIQSSNQYIGGIFSSAFLGIVIASFGLYLLRKTSARFHSWISIGQVYFAYWFALVIGGSAVTAALVSAMAFVWLSQHYQLGFHVKTMPAPLNSWLGFSLVLLLFLLLGWQAHQPASTLLLIEVIVGALLGLGIAWLGRKWKILVFHKKGSFGLTGLRVAAFLFPALLLWPREILGQPFQLAVAIGIAVLVIGFSHMGLSYYFPTGSRSKDAPPRL
ncbi:MAG: hypothetical protein HN413_18275 [Chloroflexi bacterium]|jgi:hypothetical protein|nr:hypothetical protein [Chloroflexota bacterium]